MLLYLSILIFWSIGFLWRVPWEDQRAVLAPIMTWGFCRWTGELPGQPQLSKNCCNINSEKQIVELWGKQWPLLRILISSSLDFSLSWFHTISLLFVKWWNGLNKWASWYELMNIDNWEAFLSPVEVKVPGLLDSRSSCFWLCFLLSGKITAAKQQGWE